MKVSVDRDRCVGSGQCVLAAGDVFDQGEEDGIVLLLVAQPGVERQADVEDAAATCPAQAISIR